MTVSERGSTVIIEVECCDAYEAIRLAEVLSEGMDGDGFVLSFETGEHGGETQG